jgi:hypothetical protein
MLPFYLPVFWPSGIPYAVMLNGHSFLKVKASLFLRSALLIRLIGDKRFKSPVKGTNPGEKLTIFKEEIAFLSKNPLK